MKATEESARQAFARGAWSDAYALLSTDRFLDAEDLERLAVAAQLIGRDDDSVRAWERAQREHVRLGDVDRASCCIAWLALGLLLRGDAAQAGAWFARAGRLLDAAGSDGVGRGYLQVPVFLTALGRGDIGEASALADEIIVAARRFDDRDLLALGMLASGQASLASGEVTPAMSLLDEVMLSVASGEVSPIPAGIVYCAVIEACMDVLDLRRAAEWTDALGRWCALQPDLVPYRGQCLVHRSQILQSHGEWAEAMVEVQRAAHQLSAPDHPALGLALYQLGELHRLRGDTAAAEQAYRAASRQGREPAPGIALLRLQEGRAQAAAATVRRMVDESRNRPDRPAMLAAHVEIVLAVGDVVEAARSAEELVHIARRSDLPLLHAIAAYATGSVLLAQGSASASLASLRQALVGWSDLAMPYDAARARVQIGLACRALDDHDSATMEMDAAGAAFERLGAAPDLAYVRRLGAPPERNPRGALTPRECQVLRLVATGRTNREIAADLVISEHTVGRHLQNVFMKLGLSSRAAATAYAYEHDLV